MATKKRKKVVKKYNGGGQINVPQLNTLTGVNQYQGGILAPTNPLDGQLLQTVQPLQTGQTPTIGQTGINGISAIGGVVGGEIQNNALSGNTSKDINKNKSIGGGVLKGAATGASMGSVAGPWGAAIGGAIGGIVGGIGGSRKAKEAKRELRRREEEAQAEAQRNINYQATQRGIALAGQTNDFKGQSGKGFYKNGASDNGIIGENGLQLLNGGKEQIANDLYQVKGNTHENGGIDVDYDGDNSRDVEIENNEVLDVSQGRVYSNNIKPDVNVLGAIKSNLGLKTKGTYANVSKQLGKERAKLETKGDSRFETNTKKIMLDRISKAESMLFNDQQVKNGNTDAQELGDGGELGLNKIQNAYGYSRPIYDNGNIVDHERVFLPEEQERLSNRNAPNLGANYVVNPVASTHFKPRDGSISEFELNKQRAKLNEMRALKRDYTSFKTLKNGGKVPKYEDGLFDEKLKRKNVPSSIQLGAVPDYLVGTGLPDNNSELARLERQAEFKNAVNTVRGTVNNTGSRIGSTMRNLDGSNLTNIANFATPIIGNALNRRSINQIETNINPNLIAATPFRFNDTTSARERKNAEATRQVLNNINSSSTQSNVAAKAALLSNRLRADNDVNISENQRRDAALGRFRDRDFRRSAINNQILNRTAEGNLARRNNIVVQRQAANNALAQGLTNAIQAYNVNENEQTKMQLTSLLLSDPSILERMRETNPTLIKKLGL